jgi:hypothetical protein
MTQPYYKTNNIILHGFHIKTVALAEQSISLNCIDLEYICVSALKNRRYFKHCLDNFY